MQFPCLVYRIGGTFRKPGGQPYRYTQATAETYDDLIADGWSPSYAAAAKLQLDHDGDGHAGGSLPKRKPRQKKEAPE